MGPDPLHPRLTRGFLEYAQHRGFFADPARARHPKDKPKVERSVPYARERFFKGATFDSLAHLRSEAPRWCLEVAGRRIHGTTRRQPLLVFQEEERHALLPWNGEPYEIAHWRTLKVHPDHHIQCQLALYSVPSVACPPGQEVEVRLDSKLVRIYHKDQLIKVHQRQPEGGRSTDPADYPAVVSKYTTRVPDQIISEAAQMGLAVDRFAQRLFEGPLPWARIRQGTSCCGWESATRPAPGRRLSTGPGGGPHRRAPRGTHPDPRPGARCHSRTTPAWARARGPLRPSRISIRPGQRRTAMTKGTELTPLLKRLKLGNMAPTLPERIALARREQLDYASFLEIILLDEVNRRDHQRMERRMRAAGFAEMWRLEEFDWTAAVTLDRRLLDAAFSLEFLDKREHVLFLGPAGVGKSFLAQALGHAAVAPVTTCASSMPTTSPGPWPRPGWTLRRPHFPVFPVPGPAHPGRLWIAQAHRPAVRGPLRASYSIATAPPAS